MDEHEGHDTVPATAERKHKQVKMIYFWPELVLMSVLVIFWLQF